MSFKYSQLPGDHKLAVQKPLVPVILKNGKYIFPTLALVDSGADGAVISTVIAEALNIDWRKLPVRVGFSVSGSFRLHTIKNIEARILDYSFVLTMQIIEGIGPFKCIFGQIDLFEKADILFRGYKKEFEINFRKLN